MAGVKISASDFIKMYPRLRVPELEAKAREAGLNLSRGLILIVRRRMKSGKKRVRRARSTKPSSSKTRSSVAEFRRLALALGLERARAELAALEDSLEDLVKG